MKTIIIRSLTTLCSAVLAFSIAKLIFSQDSSAASEQTGSKQTLSHADNELSNPLNLGPVLAVNSSPKGTGRPTIVSEEGLVYTDFIIEPFEVKKSNDRHGWTMINARSLEHIDLLSHNDDERERHIEENLWVTYRELVYRKDTFTDLVNQALANQEELEELILPGIEGKEYRVEVLDVDHRVNDDGVNEGSITGRLVGDPTSSVHLGYYGQREAGGITSTEQQIFLSYDPREDGQLIVKQVDDEALNYAFSGQGCGATHGSLEVGEPNAEL